MGRVQGLQSNQRPPLFQGTLHQSHSSQAHRGTDTRAYTPGSVDKCKRPPSFFPSTTHPLRSALKSSALGHSAQGRVEFLGLLFSLFVFIKPLSLRFFSFEHLLGPVELQSPESRNSVCIFCVFP